VKIQIRYLQQADSRTRLLLALCVAIGGVLLAEASLLGKLPHDYVWTPRPIEAGSQEYLQAPRPIVMPPLAAYGEILSRPLFSDTRRPPEVAATAARAPALPDPSSRWKLTGVVSTGAESHAMVTGLRDKMTQRLDTGGMIDGWKVVSIEPYRVTFESSSGTAILELKEDAPD